VKKARKPDKGLETHDEQIFTSYPGSAQVRPVCQALPASGRSERGKAARPWRSQAEPGNEKTRKGTPQKGVMRIAGDVTTGRKVKSLFPCALAGHGSRSKGKVLNEE
jgi:hypothetical protein